MAKTSQFDTFRQIGDVAPGLSSAGSTQGTATLCRGDHVTFTSVTAGQGGILDVGNAGDFRSVANHSASAELLVYPPVGGSFNGTGANTPIAVPANHAAMFIFVTSLAITLVVW